MKSLFVPVQSDASIKNSSVLYIVLLHYPVKNKSGECIGSAVTNLDLHDIARVAKTYGIKAFYVVTPFDDQKGLVERIVSHWITGTGAKYNPLRGKALKLIKIKDTFLDVVTDIESIENRLPKTVATCAKESKKTISYSKLRGKITDGFPYILAFGTAWGLSKEFIDDTDYILEPIRGVFHYNHLSVRSAVSIILDRLVGEY